MVVALALRAQASDEVLGRGRTGDEAARAVGLVALSVIA